MFQQSQSQAPKFGTLLGSTTAPTGGLFSASTQPQQRSLFGGTLGGATTTAAPTSNLFGGSTLGSSQPQQQPQQAQSLFGGSLQQQQPQAQSSLFGATIQPPPQPFGQSQPQGVAPLPPLRKSTMGLSMQAPAGGPRDKPVLEQIALIYKKWNPNDPNCALEGYTYNQVGENAISYAPNADEDPAKWEEALAKKPYEDAVPVLLRGFKALNLRIEMQNGACRMLAAKLNQLNDALVDLMQDHDLKFQVRCNEARNKHKQYTQRVIKLAAKVQILRNRGYAMDSTEEELKKKLMELEKKAFDPILGGRQEEIWARMSAARARAQILQAESEKLGQAAQQEGSVLNEEEQKSLRKLLEDYDSQLTHLKKEIDGIRQDYEEWEKAQKPATS